MRKLIVNLAKKNQTIRNILRKIMKLQKMLIYKHYCRKNKVENNVIIFEAYLGRQYACSPRAIYEEMLRQEKFKDFEFIWAFRNPEEKIQIPQLKTAKLIKHGSKEYYEAYSRAKYFVSNSRIPEAIQKRDGQVYIQTWHGTPLKRLGYDINVEGGNALNSIKDTQKKYKDDAERYDFLISPSKFTSEKLSSCFNLKDNNPKAKIIEKGYPRNDFLYKYTDEDIKKIKERLHIENNEKKMILYAPTWRDNQHKAGVGYTYELGIDFDKLKAQLEDEFIILFRPHYFVANQFDFKKYEGFIYDVSKVDDINDVYVLADMLITDYSSVFFDYANLKRPMLFYMYDLTDYKEHLRGFYISLDELPGPIVEKEDDLINEIKKVATQFTYDDKYKKFNDKYNYLEDGNAAKRVIEECITLE